ncbi:MAG TPA: alpha-ketoacid dehydrogenase subunit beta [Spirochaetia bacterium]|nr:alpha-ketoacid dehydrogenase subunit beta [Spirochaetales bacterium]HRY79880.1 alpha-ketoacid dehydrogenase subunit beta [Spirochaetia bacterium]
MRTITFSDATLEAMKEEMRRDPTVFVYGEDIVRQGGIFGQFKGLPEEFGDRIRDVPISETAIIGAALGAALTGTRPVADMHFADFISVAYDELVNQIAKNRYMFGGQANIPLVVRAPDGIINQAAAQHSQSVEGWLMNVPGLILVAPSSPATAKGLLKSSIRQNDPVIFFEHKVLYPQKGPVPEGEYLTPLGKAEIRRPGTDVTVVTYSLMVQKCEEAAKALEAKGISVEIVDLLTLKPMDTATILDSVRKTHRCVVVHEGVVNGGLGAEIAARVQAEAFYHLDAPVLRVGAKDVPIPFSPPLEKYVAANLSDIERAVLRVLHREA